MRWKWPLVLVALALLGGLAWPAWLAWRAQGGLAKAQALSQMGLWVGARKQLGRYLWLHPTSGEARLLMAEALVKDEQLPSEQAVPEALDHLAKVSDDSPRGAAARLQEGRLRLLMLRQPAKAEQALRKAAQLDPELAEAHFLLWKTLDLTGRSQLAEDIFWRVYEQTPAGERPERLREWYMSQFYPATASSDLERLMGFVAPGETPGPLTEYRRLVRFKESEPDEPLSYAALARWFYLEGDLREAIKLLDEARAALHNEPNDPFYLATEIGVLIDLGQYERAETNVRRWPEPHTGHEYWKWQAIVLDEVRGQHRESLAVYDKSLAVWPGPVEWRLRNRKASCLTRLREPQAAERERQAAKKIEKLMDDKVHRQIRASLGKLHDPDEVDKVADFYRELSCQREEQCWREHAENLRAGKSREEK